MRLPSKSNSDDAADVDNVLELRKAVAKLDADRSAAGAEIATLPAAIDAAILADEGLTADKLEKRLAAAQRAIRRCSLAAPIIAKNLFDAEEAERTRLIAKHRAAMISAFDTVHAALQAVEVANASAAEVAEAAAAELGATVAQAYVPMAAYQRVSREAVSQWFDATDESLGRRQRPVQKVAGIGLVLLTVSRRGNPGEQITLRDADAHAAVTAGLAKYAAPADVIIPVDPRRAPMPKPDARGYVQLVVIKAILGQFGLMPHDEPGAWNAGDLMAAPLSQATRFVRSGVAQAIPWADDEGAEVTV